MRASRTESIHRLLHGLVTGLQQATVSTQDGAQHQMNKYSAEPGVQSATSQAPNGRLSDPKGKQSTHQRPPEGAEGGSSQAVSVRGPRCSRTQCYKCTDGSFCRHCACTGCRRERYHLRCRLEAQAMHTGNAQHHRGEHRLHSDTRPPARHALLHRGPHNVEALPRPEPPPPRQEPPMDSLRPAPRPNTEEIHHMAQQVATAVLKDKEQREEMNSETQEKLVGQVYVMSGSLVHALIL